jgi:23S rRNA (adenine2503-C2)-methyltransferase
MMWWCNALLGLMLDVLRGYSLFAIGYWLIPRTEGSGIPVGTIFGPMSNLSGRLSAAPATLLDQTPAEAKHTIAEWVAARELPSYRSGQLLRRLWQAPVPDWSSATELPLALRAELAQEFPLPRLALDTVQQSADGTRKYLWRLQDGEAIESVLIPSGSRRTLCISSQAGCALGCSFCATGLMGFRRNLSPFEIAGQVRETVLADASDKPSNIVFMGMGEPLLNWPAVDVALSILNSPEGLGIGARHITVSTVGILPGMAEFAKRPEQFRLAISLHAARSPQRRAMMPIEKKYSLEAVLKAAEAFRRRITFEYVMIAGVNDSDADADELGRLARRVGALVNLLPLHPGGAPDLKPTTGTRIRSFADRLRNQGVEAVVRRSRGLDINAACGQLRVEVEKKRGSGKAGKLGRAPQDTSSRA